MRSAPNCLERLRTELLKMSATGQDGFEGLMQVVLTEVTGVPFRLSAAGSQGGRDGSATYRQDGISFECKLYDGSIRTESVLAKPVEFSLEPDAELWILCASVPVSDQLARKVRNVGRKVGISTRVLDWSGELPPLAVALALACGVLSKRLSDKSVIALERLQGEHHFASHAKRLRRELAEPTVGVAAATLANRHWLTARFSDRGQAIRAFGTPLAPFDGSFGKPHTRDRLVSSVCEFLTADRAGESVLCVTGGEGSGKSWLVAQAWATLEERPLMVVLSPSEFVKDRSPEDLLVEALVAQTDDPDPESATTIWRRKFARWRDAGERPGASLVVVVDGLNQRPDVDWARRIGTLADLTWLDVRLIATVRSEYFETKIKPRLEDQFTELSVADWSQAERDAILAQHGATAPGLEADERHVATLRALRNPRLLGIAVRLLRNRQVESLDQLGVSRLLLEHMYASERDALDQQPFHEYALRLREHAEDVVARLEAGDLERPPIFEGLEAIRDGRFFVALKDDPCRYKLDDGALVLALGFCAVDRLRSAHRRGEDRWAALDQVIDPIRSLDQTASVVEAVLVISAATKEEGTVIGPLVAVLARLQNPSPSLLPELRRLARAWPTACLEATEGLLLEGGRHPNLDWIEDALRAAGEEPEIGPTISSAVSDWLGYYSRPRSESASKEQIAGDGEVWFDWARVSAGEESLLEGMTSVPGKVEALSRFGLRLITGRRLTPFARGLVQTVFANGLEQDVLSVGRDVEQLVRFNRLDWRETRDALLREASVLREDATSRAGKWALVRLLRATGDPEDASLADGLVRKVSDRDGAKALRLVEEYCASDPCDPSASKPDNLAKAVEYYDKLDMSELRPDRGQTRQDHIFGMLRPAMARFARTRAAERHRDFAAHISTREGHALRFGLFALEPHNAILGRELALELLTASRQSGLGRHSDAEPVDDSRWIVSEYGRLLAFPYLSSPEQLRLLPEFDDRRGPLLRLVGLAKPLDRAALDRCLAEVCEAGHSGAICALLAFCRNQRAVVSDSFRETLSSLMESPEEIVRSTALGVVEYLDDTELVSRFAASDWTSSDSKGALQSDFFGSLVVIRAAEKGLIPWQEALARVSAGTYGVAAEVGGAQVAGMVAELIHDSIQSALQIDVGPGNRRVDIGVPSRRQSTPLFARVSERTTQGSPSSSPLSAFAQFLEAHSADPDEFLKRFAKQQARDRAFLEKFAQRLNKWRAGIVMYLPSLEAFEEIVRTSESAADQWIEWLLAATDRQLSLLRGVALSLAHAVRESSPGETTALLRRVKDVHAVVRHDHGPARVPLDAFVSWSAASTEDGVRLCFERLDRAGNDHEIALEVLAALAAGRDGLLSRFVEERWTCAEPEGMARALMVIGFSGPQVGSQWDLDAVRLDHGLLGEAWTAAKYAWDRDQWARHWFGHMCAARCPLEFWRSSVLFAKVVDARFELWRSDFDTSSELMRSFEASTGQEIDRRVKRWRSHREKKLFGGQVPADVFRP